MVPAAPPVEPAVGWASVGRFHRQHVTADGFETVAEDVTALEHPKGDRNP
jgi:hypothetical protein